MMDDKIQFNIECNICNYKGAIYISHCYGDTHLVKCGKCLHEWEVIEPFFNEEAKHEEEYNEDILKQDKLHRAVEHMLYLQTQHSVHVEELDHCQPEHKEMLCTEIGNLAKACSKAKDIVNELKKEQTDAKEQTTEPTPMPRM